MGKLRRNPKALRLMRSRTMNPALFSLFVGNPTGQDRGCFMTDDGRRIFAKDIPDAIPNKRREILKRLGKEDFHSEVHPACFILVDNEYYPLGLKMFWSGRQYFFRQDTPLYYKLSSIYYSKVQAERAFATNAITWIHIEVKTPPPP